MSEVPDVRIVSGHPTPAEVAAVVVAVLAVAATRPVDPPAARATIGGPGVDRSWGAPAWSHRAPIHPTSNPSAAASVAR